MDASHYTARETLRDGTVVTVRAIRHEDGRAVLDAFQSLDHESVYRRFLTPKKELSATDLKTLTDVDFGQIVALVVTTQSRTGETLIGGGRYAIVGNGSAELAFMTGGEHRGVGIASLLLKHLTQIARTNGLQRFEAEVLAENQPMLAVFRRSGLPMLLHREGSVLHVSLSLTGEKDQRHGT